MSTVAPVLAEHAAKLAADPERDYLLFWTPRLAPDARQAFYSKAEWLQDVPDRHGRRFFRAVEFNYTEIFMGETPEVVVKAIEKALDTDWPPVLDLHGTDPRGQLGGIYHYARTPSPDNVALLVLRDLADLTDTGVGAWLCELTVCVYR